MLLMTLYQISTKFGHTTWFAILTVSCDITKLLISTACDFHQTIPVIYILHIPLLLLSIITCNYKSLLAYIATDLFLMQHQCCTMLTFTLAYTTFIKYSWNHTPKMWHNYLFSIIKCCAAACDFHQIHNAKYWGMQLTTAILKKWKVSKCLTEVLLHLPFSSPFPYCTLNYPRLRRVF